MTALMHDAKQDIKEELITNRPKGTELHEVLFADYTILISETLATLQLYLNKIEEVSEWYGMELNKSNCEALTTNNNKRLNFRNGTRVHPQNSLKYRGCMLNDRGDPIREIAKRKS